MRKIIILMIIFVGIVSAMSIYVAASLQTEYTDNENEWKWATGTSGTITSDGTSIDITSSTDNIKIYRLIYPFDITDFDNVTFYVKTTNFDAAWTMQVRFYTRYEYSANSDCYYKQEAKANDIDETIVLTSDSLIEATPDGTTIYMLGLFFWNAGVASKDAEVTNLTIYPDDPYPWHSDVYFPLDQGSGDDNGTCNSTNWYLGTWQSQVHNITRFNQSGYEDFFYFQINGTIMNRTRGFVITLRSSVSSTNGKTPSIYLWNDTTTTWTRYPRGTQYVNCYYYYLGLVDGYYCSRLAFLIHSEETVKIALYPPWTYQGYLDYVDSLSSQYLTTSVAWETTQNRDVYCVKISSGVNRQKIIVMGNAHATELGFYSVKGCIDWVINNEWGQQSLNSYEYYFFPQLNVDGLYLGYLKENVNGNDLYRTFADPQDDETQAFFDYITGIDADLLIEFHGWNHGTIGSEYKDGFYAPMDHQDYWDILDRLNTTFDYRSIASGMDAYSAPTYYNQTMNKYAVLYEVAGGNRTYPTPYQTDAGIYLNWTIQGLLGNMTIIYNESNAYVSNWNIDNSYYANLTNATMDYQSLFIYNVSNSSYIPMVFNTSMLWYNFSAGPGYYIGQRTMGVLPSSGNVTVLLLQANTTRWRFNASSTISGSVIFTIYDLLPTKRYEIYIDGTLTEAIWSNGTGVLVLTHSAWSDHEFDIQQVDPNPTSAEQIDALIPVVIAAMSVVIVMTILVNGVFKPFSRIGRRFSN